MLIAEDDSMREIVSQVREISNSPINILLQGENGTGKELVARLIHELSDRRDKPFIAVNCSAIPENLMESEFFGFEKGAFTGAEKTTIGRFEAAEGGIRADSRRPGPAAVWRFRSHFAASRTRSNDVDKVHGSHFIRTHRPRFIRPFGAIWPYSCLPDPQPRL